MKITYTIAKVLLTLLLIMPTIGALGLLPAPTPDMYTSPQAYEFINMLMETRYINIMQAMVFVLAVFCLWTRRGALAALLLLPVTVNILGFHAFIDGGLFTMGAIMANILAILNLYFLWVHRNDIYPLLKSNNV